jgi:hypothetical protein
MVRLLKSFGYVAAPQNGTSHQHWRLFDGDGKLVSKVTLDEHIEPYSGDLLKSMMRQMNLGKTEFYAALAEL